MNVYVVVEGHSDKAVYARWIPQVNPSLCQVQSPDDIAGNSFYIVTGGGYPAYFQTIRDAVSDVTEIPGFDRLVVSADSEDMSLAEKVDELTEFFSSLHCPIQYVIVVQHFCLETWALGNRVVIRATPRSPRLVEYKRFFDVRTADPELLPAYPPEDLPRAQFAAKYLRIALNDRYGKLTYSKRSPEFIAHPKYLERLRMRLRDTGHIPSFGAFVTAFL